MKRSLAVFMLAFMVPSYQAYSLIRSTSRYHRRQRFCLDSSIEGSDGTFRKLYRNELPPWLIDRLEEMGYEKPTLVQLRSIDTLLSGSDAIVHAQTGSGKTLAYLLPLFSCIDPSRASVQGLVIVPTRELGLQVAAVAKRIAAGTGRNSGGRVMIMSTLEGSKNKRQRAWAWAEPPHIVIGNPETLTTLISSGAIRSNSIRYVVIDEVDACLESTDSRNSLSTLLGKYLSPTYAENDDEEELVSADINISGSDGLTDIKRRRITKRQTVFASATIPQHNHFIRQCVSQQWTLNEPLHIEIHPKESMPKNLSHYCVIAEPPRKLAALRSLIRKQLKLQENQDRVLIFAHKNRPLDEMAMVLDKDLRRDFEPQEESLAAILREDLGLTKRAEVVSLFREGKIRVLLTTDLAARGIDIPEITHVFQFDLPDTYEGYIHRGGRAGRLGRKGQVISIISPEQEFVLKRIANAVGVHVSQIGKSKASEEHLRANAM